MGNEGITPAADIGLASLVRRFPDARVLVLGDVMLDRYVSGSASRLSPEAPIPVLRPSSSWATLGGAANVALNVATLGGRVALVGVIGKDAAGDEVARLLAAAPGVTPHLVVAPGRPTTAKTRFLVGVHQLLRLDEEVTAAIDAAMATALLERFAGALDAADIVVLSDYAKGVLTDHEARLGRGGTPRHDDKPRHDAAVRQQVFQLRAVRIVADHTDRHDLPTKRCDIHRDVVGTAESGALGGRPQHRDRRLRRQARRVTTDVAVEHHIAQHQDTRRVETLNVAGQV